MAGRGGVVYLRTTRGAYPVLYGPDEEFPIGGAKVVRSSPDDQVTLIGAGVTLHNCLAAADQLGRDGIAARVLAAWRAWRSGEGMAWRGGGVGMGGWRWWSSGRGVAWRRAWRAWRWWA